MNQATFDQALHLLEHARKRTESTGELQAFFSTGMVPLIFDALPDRVNLRDLARVIYQSRTEVLEKFPDVPRIETQDQVEQVLLNFGQGGGTINANLLRHIRGRPPFLQQRPPGTVLIVRIIRPGSDVLARHILEKAGYERCSLFDYVSFANCNTFPQEVALTAMGTEVPGLSGGLTCGPTKCFLLPQLCWTAGGTITFNLVSEDLSKLADLFVLARKLPSN